MARIAGVDLPEEKRLDIALTYIYGIGRSNVLKVLKQADMDAAQRLLRNRIDRDAGKSRRLGMETDAEEQQGRGSHSKPL